MADFTIKSAIAPDFTMKLTEAIGAGPYLELFARQTRPGWTAWGNQADKFAVL